jgi:RecA-family ATPase
MRDLLAEPDEQIAYIVDDLLPAGGDSLCVAKPKAGKSTLVRCLALAVARGTDFLGRKTVQGPVFYLALEEKRSEVRAHFRAMGARDDDPIFIFCAVAPEDGLAQLREAAKLRKPALVIVDPLFRFVRMPDGNDYAKVGNSLEPLHAFARETGAHTLMTHHAPKGEKADISDAPLGSTALFGAVDTLLVMKRNDKYRTLATRQRYGTDLDEITLEFDPQARTVSAGRSRAEVDQYEAVQAIVEFLQTQANPVDEATIHESVEGRKQVKVKALRQAVKEQKITRIGSGKKSDTYHYSVQRDSCSLVPTYSPEQTKQTSKDGPSASTDRADTGSRVLDDSKIREQTSPELVEEFEL